MISEDSARSGLGKGFLFFLAWFVAGGLVAFVTYALFMIAAMGGFGTPPVIWLICYRLGTGVLPFLLTLGGVPAAIQIARGQAWKKSALIAFAVCAISWLVLAGVVFLWPLIFGWSG